MFAYIYLMLTLQRYLKFYNSGSIYSKQFVKVHNNHDISGFIENSA